MESYDCIVIGGGPSGMMAAGEASIAGEKVLLLERNDQLGVKLSISGKGRCNITNKGDIESFIENFNKEGRFLYNCFHRFFNEDLIGFFRDLGVETKVERGGRVFPASDYAHSVVNAMKIFLFKSRVKIIFNKRVKELLTKGSKVIGVKTFDLDCYYSNSVIVATGGLSYTYTGSTGDGYEMLARVGHKIIKPLPSLVGIEVKESHAKDLQGLSLRNIKASLIVNGRLIKSIFGEMIFTHFGLSGPIILSLSRDVVKFIDSREKDVVISLNLKPALDRETLENRLLRDIENFGRKCYKNLLKNLLPNKLIPVFIRLSKIEGDKKTNQITQAQRMLIYGLLTDFRFTVRGARHIEEAIVTQGGVDTSEVNPKTMESKLIKGLYIAGELLDVDALTGGYNLQAAFSTGYIAGKSVSVL